MAGGAAPAPSASAAGGAQQQYSHREDEKALLLDALDSGSDEEAAGKLRSLAQRFPANPHFPLAEARLAARRGEAGPARQLFRRATEVAVAALAAGAPGAGRDASVALQAWGTFELDRGQGAEARHLFQRAVVADPRHAAAHCSLGRLAEAEGQLDAAAAHFEAALAGEPKHAPSLQALALLAARQGRTSRARKLFEGALSQLPDNPQLYQAWACMEWRLGNYRAAKRLFLQGAEECLPHAPLLAAHAK